MTQDLIHSWGDTCQCRACVLRRELIAMTEQRDRLAKALHGMLDLWGVVGGSDTDYCVEQAEIALQSLNQP